MLRKISLTVAVLTGGGLAAMGACGGDDGGNPDARRFDAPVGTPDANVDAEPGGSITGTMSFLEATVFVGDGSGGAIQFAQGPSFRMAFIDPALTGAPVMETMPGSPFGCKAFEYTPAQFGATLGEDLGTIDVTFASGGVPIPTCAFLGAPFGYACPATTTASGADDAIIGPGPAGGTATFTDGQVTYDDAAIGRYLVIQNATAAANNGAFPIVGRAGDHTLVYANPVAVTGTGQGATSTSITIAGLGPTPSVPDPGFIADNASMSVTFASSDTQAFPNFVGSLPDFANDFTLSAASLGTIVNVPLNGSSFTVDCESAGTCGDALSSVLNIQTTDTPVGSVGPFTMPPPTAKAVLVRCTSDVLTGGTSVVVPPEYSAFIQNSGATRVQATFVRGSLLSGTGIPNSKLVALGGHSAVGFTTPPEL